jgi:type IV fimbrial biogenesis protein FimT
VERRDGMVAFAKVGTMPQRGFTIIELMFVVIILAILVGLAAPSFSELARTQRVRAAAVDLYSDITFARSEAIKRGAPIFVAPKDSATPKDWALGWDVRLTSLTGTIIKTQDPLGGGITASGPGSIVFGQAGRPTATANIEIKHADLDSSKWRCLAVDLGGRPASKVGGCS